MLSYLWCGLVQQTGHAKLIQRTALQAERNRSAYSSVELLLFIGAGYLPYLRAVHLDTTYLRIVAQHLQNGMSKEKSIFALRTRKKCFIPRIYYLHPT